MAAQTEQTAMQARAAAAAFEAAFMMTVPPPVIAANRVLLLNLIATNFFGQNTPAIAVTEAQYMEMWAQDAAAMYGYTASSAVAMQVPQFSPSPNTTTPDAAGDQAAAVSQATSEPAGNSAQSAASSTTQLASSATAPQAVQQGTTTAAAANPAAAANQPWWVQFLDSFFTIPTPTNPNGLNPNVYTVLFKNLTGFPYFGVGQSRFYYSIQQQTTFGIGATAGAQGAWYPTPQFAGLGALGGGHPGGAAAAHLSSSIKVGGLSVPSSWGGAAPAALEEQALQATTVNYATAAGPTNNGVLQGMPPGALGRRGATGFTHKYGFKRNVLVRPPSAG
jgi:PPE-repeat protein